LGRCAQAHVEKLCGCPQPTVDAYAVLRIFAHALALQHRGDEPHLLREVFRTYQVLLSGFARKTEMPASRFALMRLLANSEGDVGVTDLARQLGINPAAVTRQVQELEREGLTTL
jgi:hypothetical protein